MLSYIHEEQAGLRKVLSDYPSQIDPVIKNAPIATNHWLILATGSSINAAKSAKLYMQKIAHVQIDIEEPYNYTNYEPINENIDLVIGISQSGQSTATITAIKRVVKQNHAYAIAVTSRPQTEIAEAANATLDILTGQEKVGYVTLGYNATVLSLMLLGLRSGVLREQLTANAEQSELAEFSTIINHIDETVQKSSAFAHQFETDFALAPQFTSIGYGAIVGTVGEMQTKFTEVVRFPANGYELEAFMHGPYLGVNGEHRQFFIETNANSNITDKERKLKNYELRTTPHVFTISLTDEKPAIADGQTLQLFAVADELKAPLLAVIPFQVFAWFIAKSKGVNLPHLIFNDFSEMVHNKTTVQDYV